MKVLFVASEAYPLIKTGGLADVAGTLPLALKKNNIDVRLLLPNYTIPNAENNAFISSHLNNLKTVCSLGNPFGFGEITLLSGTTNDDLDVWLIDCPELYSNGSDIGAGPYLDSNGSDHDNNHQRFAVLSWAGATLGLHAKLLGWQADLVHAHDWQAGLIPAYFKTWQQQCPPVVFTIHNLQFTGVFEGHKYSQLGLASELYQLDGLEYYDNFSTLKAAIQYSDAITTVSPTYAGEIQTAEFGCGLEGLLQQQAGKLSGILNGVDYNIWDPSNDKAIAKTYGPRNLGAKNENRKQLLKHNGLPEQDSAPVFGVVSRLSGQKGLDLVISALPEILARGAQLVVLGSGDKSLEQAYLQLAENYPEQIAVTIGYDENYSHLLQAGCDCLLIPSRFEPCGLTQLYALKYGTLPLVRYTGGLADSVSEGYDGKLQTGFVFGRASVDELAAAMLRAIDAYKDKKHWQQLQKNAMKQDFSWDKAADEYTSLYERVIANRT